MYLPQAHIHTHTRSTYTSDRKDQHRPKHSHKHGWLKWANPVPLFDSSGSRSVSGKWAHTCNVVPSAVGLGLSVCSTAAPGSLSPQALAPGHANSCSCGPTPGTWGTGVLTHTHTNRSLCCPPYVVIPLAADWQTLEWLQDVVQTYRHLNTRLLSYPKPLILLSS